MAAIAKVVLPGPPTVANPRYSIPRMPVRNPNILGIYRQKPTGLPPGVIAKRRGGGLGWVTVKAPVAPAGRAAAAPAGTMPNSYSEYAAYPWAQRELVGLDRTEKSHEAYASTVGDWLGKSLAALTGIDPNAPGLNSQLQQQYLANIAGPVGGALNAAATATPMTPMATTPGGLAIGNTAFLGDAARNAAAEQRSATLAAAQVQSALNTMQPNTYAQGIMRSYADMQAGLPALYSQKREDLRSKIDQFITTSEETARHNRVTEANAAFNAQTNAAIAFGKLGIDTSKLANTTAAGSAPAPYGYNRDPATGRLVRDPSIPTASSSSGGGGGGGSAAPSAARGQYAPNALAKQGFVGGWKVRPKAKPAGAKGSFVQATDGTFWIKSGSAAKSAKPYVPQTSTKLQASLAGYWKAGGSGGIEERYSNDPKGAGTWLAQWVRDNKRDFVVPGKGRKVDVTKLRQVLGSVGGRPSQEALSILVRGYIDPQGNWK